MALLPWKTLYATATGLAQPYLRRLVSKRLAAGKEDPARFAERFGTPGTARPVGMLLWIHAASVGESMSVRPLIDALVEAHPQLHILLTTTTVTSAKLLADRPPPNTIHQFAPLDHGGWIERFLDHWQPNGAIWVESELWPAMIWRSQAHSIPLVLINGRLSAASERSWRWAPGLIRSILQCFSLILGQTEAETARFSRLGAKQTSFAGNLKYSVAPLPVDQTALQALRAEVGNRPLWLAASTHPGEDEIVLEAHAELTRRFPDLLTIVVPRHPERGDAIASMITEQGIPFSRRSMGEGVHPGNALYLADTLGELGLFYRLARIALVAGSLKPGIGGHNPIEAAQLDCAVLQGPYTENFAAVTQQLSEADAQFIVSDGAEIAAHVGQLLSAPGRRENIACHAKKVALWNSSAAERIFAQIEPVLFPEPQP
ncbi:MAG: 3-deoxy-D-manno-octulosonic acid transferase [Magnetospiraceae bacterium]